mgnify:CR=1 FL=1|jgi:hypothetical protein|tara:strand:- start:697 stop:2220 length:1524 start_codon:yes stop_codon:yes gene_type:complete
MGYLKNLKNEVYALESNPLPSDPTKPINPFAPKPTGPTLPDRQMAAYGGIMGAAGRKQYGIGSWFQENIMDPIKDNPEAAAAAAIYGLDTFGGDQGILGGRLPGGKRYINDAVGTAVNFITGRDRQKNTGSNDEIEEEIKRVVKENRSEGYKDGKFQLSDILDIGKDAVDFVTGGKKGNPQNKNTNRNENYSEGTYGNGQFEFSDILDFLGDKEKTIPLGMIGTYIKEKFFPGEKEPDPYEKYLSNRKADVENYLRLYGPKDFKRDVSKNPYSQEEIEQHVFDNTPEYRDKAASGGIMNIPRKNYILGGKITASLEAQPGSVPSGNLDDILSVFKNKFGGKLNSGKSFAPETSEERISLDELSPEMLLGGMKTPMGLNEEERGITSLLMQALRDLNFDRTEAAMGGRMNYFMGGDTPEENAMQAAGVEGLDININPEGIKELDMRETGGFIPPVGIKEKEDDIPAMLSNNEFVFTADAVKGMGDGDVDKGAERMYSMMKKLENGGRV